MTFLFLDDSKTLPARYINISFCFSYYTLIGLSCTIGTLFGTKYSCLIKNLVFFTFGFFWPNKSTKTYFSNAFLDGCAKKKKSDMQNFTKSAAILCSNKVGHLYCRIFCRNWGVEFSDTLLMNLLHKIRHRKICVGIVVSNVDRIRVLTVDDQPYSSFTTV